MKYVLNFGAGVNSTALVVEIIKRKMPLDFVIFADTGSELPETYEHLEIMKKWFEDNGINFLIVKSKYDKKLYDYYFDKRTVPWRRFRDCTDKFKKQPIRAFIKQFKPEGVTQYIGISYEELHRMRTSDSKWITFEYPLVDWKINRLQCLKIIEDAKLNMPVKSGCFMCPFQGMEAWKQLLLNKPELYKQARIMEEQNRTYPKTRLPWKGTLKELEESVKQQKSLEQFEGEPLCGGYCMT